MSDKTLSRRADFKITFEGADVTADIRPYFISLAYTDNEEDETDDLQIKLEDSDSLWQNELLNPILSASSSQPGSHPGSPSDSPSSKYKVTANVQVHSRPGTQYYVYGTLAYGTIIKVKSISGGWANFIYDSKNAYCSAKYLKKVKPKKSGGSSSEWNIGDAVIANGRPQYTSYGEGTPGASVTNYHGTVTYLNLKNGVPYPIGVGKLGWFALSQVEKTGESDSGTIPAGNKGLKIQALMLRQNWHGDGKDESLDCGQFELDSISADGPPAVITIKATALPYSSAIQKTKKSKAWENITLSEILREICDSNGLGYMYLSAEDPEYTRIEQYEMTDIAFLQQLCRDAGCALKCAGNTVVIFDQAEFENNPAIMSITRGCGYSKYKFSTNETNTYTSCTVSYTKPDGVISATAYIDDYDKNSEKNKCLKLHRAVSSESEALNLAYKMLRLYNKFEYKATFDFPFNPSLCAGCTVDLTSDWGLWRGRYVIKTAKHSIGKNSKSQITLRRIPS